MHPSTGKHGGFTLIELSIVLIIVGLLAAGILVGRTLISSASVTALITQANSYKSAVAAFKDKYSALPGDIPEPHATRFGFASRGIYAGTGDGNGTIEGILFYAAGFNFPSCDASGESALFWRDLSTAKLIEHGFTAATASNVVDLTSTQLPAYFPPTRMGNDSYVTVTGNIFRFATLTGSFVGSAFGKSISGQYVYNFLTVEQMHSLDSKMDDGLPGRGVVVATQPATMSACYTTFATAGSSNSCCDNGNTAGRSMTYSLSQNSKRINCGFHFYNAIP